MRSTKKTAVSILTSKDDLAQAIETLGKIEYSSDGFVKRYPDEKDYDKAMGFLRGLVPASTLPPTKRSAPMISGPNALVRQAKEAAAFAETLSCENPNGYATITDRVKELEGFVHPGTGRHIVIVHSLDVLRTLEHVFSQRRGLRVGVMVGSQGNPVRKAVASEFLARHLHVVIMMRHCFLCFPCIADSHDITVHSACKLTPDEYAQYAHRFSFSAFASTTKL